MWCQSQFLEDLQKYGSIKAVCNLYADEKTGWRGYYTDVLQWRKNDGRFNDSVLEVLALSNVTQFPGPGRDRKDLGNLEWQQEYCDTLYQHDGNRAKAAEVTPYSLKTIIDMLDKDSTSYDKEFHDMVAGVEARIASELEEMFLKLRHDHNYDTFENSKIAQTKGWVALKGLERMDPKRWGRQSELKISGRLDHVHKTDSKLSKGEVLNQLWEEQKLFLERRRSQLGLPSGEIPAIDVEIITEKKGIPLTAEHHGTLETRED